MRLTTKVLIGILIAIIGLNSVLIVRNLYKEIRIIKIETIEQIENKFNQITKKLEQMDEDIGATLDIQSQRITMLPKVIQADKKILEVTLQKINVMVYNKTLQALGSGVTLKYKNKYYILTAGHLAETKTDNLILMENDQEICELEIVKHNYSWNETEITETNDLLLLKPKNQNIKPKIYIELNDYEPIKIGRAHV